MYASTRRTILPRIATILPEVMSSSETAPAELPIRGGVADRWRAASRRQCTGNYFQARREAKVLHIFTPSGLGREGVKPERRDVGKIEAGSSLVSASRDAERTKDASLGGGKDGKGEDEERGTGSDRETMRNYEKRSTGPHEERCPKRETIFAQVEGRLEIDGDRQRPTYTGYICTQRDN